MSALPNLIRTARRTGQRPGALSPSGLGKLSRGWSRDSVDHDERRDEILNYGTPAEGVRWLFREGRRLGMW